MLGVVVYDGGVEGLVLGDGICGVSWGIFWVGIWGDGWEGICGVVVERDEVGFGGGGMFDMGCVGFWLRGEGVNVFGIFDGVGGK